MKTLGLQETPFLPWQNELRNLHYAWAQYSDPTTGSKATPEVRIEHLRRILELGFTSDYIYKFLAEAYHDSGDDDQGRAYLRQAYELNPELIGAVKISRALGFVKPSDTSPRRAKAPSKYKYSRPEQIPSYAQVREWAGRGQWDAVMAFANPHDYSPRILSKARETLRHIATSLEGCRDAKAIEALIPLLNFNYYWDVSEAAMTTLSKIGDNSTVKLLDEFEAGSPRGQAHLEECISYLRARVSSYNSLRTTATPRELLAQAEVAIAREDDGRARLMLENLLENIKESDPIYFDATILLARTCARMNDARTSVELIKPFLPTLSEESRSSIYEEVAKWLWSEWVFQSYDPIHDENYRLVLEIHIELSLIARTPDDVLKNLRSITRWLEPLGAATLAQWISQLIRTEAPGTWYVDKHNREQYNRNVDLSPHMKDYLSEVERRVKTDVSTKLKQILGSANTLEDAVLLFKND